MIGGRFDESASSLGYPSAYAALRRSSSRAGADARLYRDARFGAVDVRLCRLRRIVDRGSEQLICQQGQSVTHHAAQQPELVMAEQSQANHQHDQRRRDDPSQRIGAEDGGRGGLPRLLSDTTHRSHTKLATVPIRGRAVDGGCARDRPRQTRRPVSLRRITAMTTSNIGRVMMMAGAVMASVAELFMLP